MSELKNILSQSACLSQKQMLHYLNKEMEREEVLLVEEHVSGCMFCNDALDGLALLPKEDLNILLNEIEKETEDKIATHLQALEDNKKKAALIGHKGGKSKKSWVAAAGIFLLLFGGGAALFSYFNNFHREEIQLAEGKGDYAPTELKKDAIKESSRELSTIAMDDTEAEAPPELNKNTSTPNINNASIKKVPRAKASVSKNEKALEDRMSSADITAQEENSIVAAPKTAPIAEKKAKSIQLDKEKEIIAKQDNKSIQDLSHMNTATMPQYKGKLGEAQTGEDDVFKDKYAKRKKKYVESTTSRSAGSVISGDGMQQQKASGKKAEGISTLQQGMYEYNNGNYKKSIRLFKKALRKKNATSISKTKYYLALALQKNGNTSEAQKIFEELSKSGPYKNAAQKMLSK